jgi:hypothetical protein
MMRLRDKHLCEQELLTQRSHIQTFRMLALGDNHAAVGQHARRRPNNYTLASQIRFDWVTKIFSLVQSLQLFAFVKQYKNRQVVRFQTK